MAVASSLPFRGSKEETSLYILKCREDPFLLSLPSLPLQEGIKLTSKANKVIFFMNLKGIFIEEDPLTILIQNNERAALKMQVFLIIPTVQGREL